MNALRAQHFHNRLRSQSSLHYGKQSDGEHHLAYYTEGLSHANCRCSHVKTHILNTSFCFHNTKLSDLQTGFTVTLMTATHRHIQTHVSSSRYDECMCVYESPPELLKPLWHTRNLRNVLLFSLLLRSFFCVK